MKDLRRKRKGIKMKIGKLIFFTFALEIESNIFLVVATVETSLRHGHSKPFSGNINFFQKQNYHATMELIMLRK